MGMKYLVTLDRKEDSLAELKRTGQKQRTPNWHGTNQMEVKHESMSSRMGPGGEMQYNSVQQSFPPLIKIWKRMNHRV